MANNNLSLAARKELQEFKKELEEFLKEMKTSIQEMRGTIRDTHCDLSHMISKLSKLPKYDNRHERKWRPVVGYNSVSGPRDVHKTPI